MTSAKPTLAQVLKTGPKFHRLIDIHSSLDDTLTSWAAQLEVLEAIQRLLQPGMRTLETGCGHSTVMFALSEAQHYCVTPAQAEADRVRAFCAQAGIEYGDLHFKIGNSQDELPRLPADLEFELVFIDGGHFFPIPCIDWYYSDMHLKEGGVLVVDDLRIPTVRMLYEFLRADKNWEQILLINDTVFMRKLRHAPNLHDWIEQAFNQSYPDWSFLRLQDRAVYKLAGIRKAIAARFRVRP